MEENDEFLKYIYHEDIYIIAEPDPPTQPSAVVSGDTDSEPETSIVQESDPVRFFGQNEKGIVILVNDPFHELLKQSELDFLMKIIESGLRFSKNDFALVNVAKYPVKIALDEIPHFYRISFGVDLSHFHEHIPHYKIQDFDGIKVLLAESLVTIEMDRSKKMKLWNALKTMFDI